jgi:hypothetical protein
MPHIVPIDEIMDQIRTTMGKVKSEMKPSPEPPDNALLPIFEYYSTKAPKASVNQSFDNIVTQVTTWNLNLLLRFYRDFKLSKVGGKSRQLGITPEKFRMLFHRLRSPTIDFVQFCGLLYEVADEFYGQDFEAYDPGIARLNSMQKYARFKLFLLAANP